ncbi:MAG: PDZ domain-containing protein, partial [Clostridia bacterium]|nr:PDZ domain-containing protein [Clostridia bacterium]
MKSKGINSIFFKAALGFIVFVIILSFALTGYAYSIPGNIAVFASEDIDSRNIAPFVCLEASSEGNADAKLFGVVKLKEVDVNLLTKKELLLGGMPFGVKLYTDGLLISGSSCVDCKDNDINPGELAGIRAGDIIKKVNGKDVIRISDLLDAAKESNGNEITLKILRNNELLDISITPVKSESEGVYKLGLWVRDGTAGIGTVTYIDPNTNAFGGLGHGVCDSETGKILPMSNGKLTDVVINNVKKGESG